VEITISLHCFLYCSLVVYHMLSNLAVQPCFESHHTLTNSYIVPSCSICTIILFLVPSSPVLGPFHLDCTGTNWPGYHLLGGWWKQAFWAPMPSRCPSWSHPSLFGNSFKCEPPFVLHCDVPGSCTLQHQPPSQTNYASQQWTWRSTCSGWWGLTTSQL